MHLVPSATLGLNLIIQLAQAIATIPRDATTELVSANSAIDANVPAWCPASVNEPASLRAEKDRYFAQVKEGTT